MANKLHDLGFAVTMLTDCKEPTKQREKLRKKVPEDDDFSQCKVNYDLIDR